MVFVTYSHADERWRKRFDTISKPLQRYHAMEFWSDKKLTAGEWEPQIKRAMRRSDVAVLLVSDNFLASDYIMQKEVPYLLKAQKERGLVVLWAYLSPCLLETTNIRKFQAMTVGDLKPLVGMDELEWKETFLAGCRMIDAHLKKLEKPR